jgi:hypothetical protein
MKVKITIKTPPNQANKAIESSKKVFLGKNKDFVIQEEVIAHDEFYWVLVIQDLNQMEKLYKKCAAGEVMIREFYRKLFKEIDRANKISKKLGKPISWVKARVKKMMGKRSTGDVEGFEDQINNTDFFEIEDREVMKKFLEESMIKVEEVGSDAVH